MTTSRTMARNGPKNRRFFADALVEGIPNPNTRRNLQGVLTALDQHFRPFKGTETELQLIRFIRAQEANGATPQTLRQKVSILKRIIECACLQGSRKDNPVSRDWAPKVKISVKPKCPDRAEVERLKKVLSDEKGFLGARDRAIIGLMRFEALRVHEVSGLNHEDMCYTRNQVEMKIKGKGGFVTVVQLYPQSIELIKAYRKFIPTDLQCGPFFIPAFEPGQRMGSRSIRKRCDQLFKKAKWRPGLSCHSLRHLLAVQLIENGLPLSETQRKLRHRFISSTFSYYSDVPTLRNPEKVESAYKFLGTF